MSAHARKGKGARIRNWENTPEADFSHEQKRFRGNKVIARPSGKSEADYFSDITPNGLVISPYGALAFVRRGAEELLCRVGADLMSGKNSVLAPGDDVLVNMDESPPLITALALRRTKLSRPAVGVVREQPIAANVDTVIIVASVAQPAFRHGLVDRYLIAVQVGNVQPLLCINKIDLTETIPEDALSYEALGVQTVYTSCKRGDGIDRLAALIKGKVTVVAGQSGVGKSSLIKTLNPDMTMVTAEVTKSNKGRHTTSTSRLYEFGGIRIIDTPGVRELGLWGVSHEELTLYFPDIAAFAIGCRFRDCTHLHEPHCAVKTALEEGGVTRLRYESYVRIRKSLIDKPR